MDNPARGLLTGQSKQTATAHVPNFTTVQDSFRLDSHAADDDGYVLFRLELLQENMYYSSKGTVQHL